MADLNYDEMSALEKQKHEQKMKEIAFQARVDQQTEQVKLKNNQTLEEQKAKNQSKLELKKVGGLIVKGIVLAGAWFGLTCLADRIEVPRRNVRKID